MGVVLIIILIAVSALYAIQLSFGSMTRQIEELLEEVEKDIENSETK